MILLIKNYFGSMYTEKDEPFPLIMSDLVRKIL